ncbi:MAG: Rpn family recombination-promoting nuclease/putative transposase [Spirobacillus cienkowskii]|jgi:predicted transposase/invertase (TIGR01784 family)|uniref:Rpn family recombination-promoting nuclease/putative transposase n=1 Tax=Spirobacillus cienkowskii TaxID=495820 RepID=A0A369KRV1_9BACT|nr:MAG: Rpn family recombination-promoting nuclease/putative transposase [Spirobacillus cienkowskii]
MIQTESVDILDPKVDSIFKKIFGEKKELFIDFVNSVFADKNEKLVKSVTFLNTELSKDIANGKECILDVRAELDDGSQINIEVQVTPQKHYIKRNLFYWSRLYVEQISLGEHYKGLKRCVCINLINFDLFPENNSYHRMLSGLDVDTHEVLAPDLEIHYLIIPKMPKGMYNGSMTRLEKWLLFFQAPEKKVLEELAMQDRLFEQAKETLYFLSHNPAERVAYTQRLKYLLDTISQLDDAKTEGKAEGIEIGKVEGIEIGKAEGIEIGKRKNIIEIAKTMKASDFPMMSIIKVTKLSQEEIENL